jgi:hypothetical protein
MAWISLFLLYPALLMAQAEKAPAAPPKLLTKHSMDAIRFISHDGRLAYVKKRPGVLGLVSYFRSVDFVSDAAHAEFSVTTSADRRRVVVEVIPNFHTQFNPYKLHKLLVSGWGDPVVKEVGQGIAPTLHLGDEWLSFYDPLRQSIVVQNLVTEKKYDIRLSPKPGAFFVPQVRMINPETVVFTDINETGVAGVIAHNLLTAKRTVMLKSTQSGTKVELCQGENYLAIGEFPFEGVTRGSRVLHLKLGSSNLAGHTTLYESSAQDLGNMVCLSDSIFFVKTMSQHRRTGVRTTEAVKLDIRTTRLKVLTSLSVVNQLLNIDGRILAPVRGEFYVLEGDHDLSSDTLRGGTPTSREELPIEL